MSHIETETAFADRPLVEQDSITLHARWIERQPTEAEKALAVFLITPQTRAVLDVLDPKAVEQARNALRLPY